jgi:hypothetical protein
MRLRIAVNDSNDATHIEGLVGVQIGSISESG